MLRENKGWAAFITTPRGDNHAKTMFEVAQNSERGLHSFCRIEDTKALTEADLKEALLEYQALYGIDMGRAIYEQEYLCSFSAAIVGAYFGAEMRMAERDGRIKKRSIRRAVSCSLRAWTSAKRRTTRCGCSRLFRASFASWTSTCPRQTTLDDWCIDLRERGFSGNTYVPHDIMVTEWGSGKTRFDRLLDKKMNPRRIARVSLADGLQAGRMAINAAVFDKEKCELG
jgi:phage terminase large subunit